MAVRTLTVSLTDLDLDPVEGCRVTVRLERSGVEAGSLVIPTVKETETTDDQGECTFSLSPNESGSRYQAKVFNAEGRKVIDKLFDMPDEDANLADLIDLSNTTPETTPVQRASQTPISVIGLTGTDVQTAVGQLVRMRVKVIAGTAHTLTADDLNYNVLRFNSGSLCTLTVPAQSEVAILAGHLWNVRNRGGGGLAYAKSSAATSNGDAIEGAGTSAVGAAANKLSSLMLETVVEGVNTWVTAGDMST